MTLGGIIGNSGTFPVRRVFASTHVHPLCINENHQQQMDIHMIIISQLISFHISCEEAIFTQTHDTVPEMPITSPGWEKARDALIYIAISFRGFWYGVYRNVPEITGNLPKRSFIAVYGAALLAKFHEEAAVNVPSRDAPVLTQHSALSTQHSALVPQHSALSTLHRRVIGGYLQLFARPLQQTPCPNSYIYQGFSSSQRAKKGFSEFFAYFVRLYG